MLEKITDAVIDDLEVITEIVTNKRRSMGDMQKRILLNQRVSSVILNINETAKLENIPSDEMKRVGLGLLRLE